MVIFHSCVSLPEGNRPFDGDSMGLNLSNMAIRDQWPLEVAGKIFWCVDLAPKKKTGG